MEEKSIPNFLDEGFMSQLGFSDSYLKIFFRKLKGLTLKEKKELNKNLQPLLQKQYALILINDQLNGTASEDFSLSALEQGFVFQLPPEKAELMEKWVQYLYEIGSKSIGKIRLEVLLKIFEENTVADLEAEMEYRINLGHSGLVFNNKEKDALEIVFKNQTKEYLERITKENQKNNGKGTI